MVPSPHTVRKETREFRKMDDTSKAQYVIETGHLWVSRAAHAEGDSVDPTSRLVAAVEFLRPNKQRPMGFLGRRTYKKATASMASDGAETKETGTHLRSAKASHSHVLWWRCLACHARYTEG